MANATHMRARFFYQPLCQGTWAISIDIPLHFYGKDTLFQVTYYLFQAFLLMNIKIVVVTIE